MNTYSPYQCAKVVNAQLQEQGIEKVLPPQMFYTYTKKEYIKSFTDSNNKVRVRHEDLVQWYTKYIDKLQGSTSTEPNTTNVDPNQLTFEI